MENEEEKLLDEVLLEDNPKIEDTSFTEEEAKEVTSQFMERFKNIQPELRNYIKGQGYAEDFMGIVKTYSLAKEYASELEYITTMTLLGFIPPKEVKDEVYQALPSISSSVKDGICEYIWNRILTKERVALLEKNWQEDDAREKEAADFIEMQDVPKPEYAPKTKPKEEYSMRPNGVLTEERVSNLKKDDKADAWETKLEEKRQSVSSRTEVDASIPKAVNTPKKTDLYREIPE